MLTTTSLKLIVLYDIYNVGDQIATHRKLLNLKIIENKTLSTKAYYNRFIMSKSE